jgi:hypothetical protein
VDRDGWPSAEVRDGNINLIKVIIMKIADRLPERQKKQLKKIKSPKNKKQHRTKPQKEEKINWQELMGSNGQRLYRGKGGALKRR